MHDHDSNGASDADVPAYVSTMSEADVARIREWHESACQMTRAESERGEQTFEYLGRTIVVPPHVFPINGTSRLLGEAVLAEVRQGERVLDMGAGSGVNAILAAGAAAEVVAVDVNPHAVEAARANAVRNGVADKIEVLRSDVFDDVNGEFDLIIFDPPFRWFAARDVLELSCADEDYRTLRRFFHAARRRLRPGGRMLVFFGSSGDLDYLRRLADAVGFHVETAAHRRLLKDGHSVDYHTFRMTPDR
ncbi:MAG: methyltransferase [Stackebrandtia sp.]